MNHIEDFRKANRDFPAIFQESIRTDFIPFVPRQKSLYVKVVKTHSDFQDASTSKDVTLLVLPQKAEIVSAFYNVHTAFSGGAITTYTISIGQDGAETGLGTAQDATTTGLKLAKGTDFTTNRAIYSLTASTTIEARATSGGANLNVSTAGVAVFYFSIVFHK